MTQGVAVGLVLSVWAVSIAILDVLKRRVPNLLLLVVAVPAVVTQFLLGRGLLGIDWSDASIASLVGLLLTAPGYLLHQVGAGDIKYSVLLGFLVGVAAILQILLISALVIGLLSLATLVQAKWRGIAVRKIPAALALSTGFVLHLAGR